MKRQMPTHTAVRVPLGPYEPGEEAWYQRVDSQAYAFVAPASTLRPESVARTLLCLNVCADLAWEWRVGLPSHAVCASPSCGAGSRTKTARSPSRRSCSRFTRR